MSHKTLLNRYYAIPADLLQEGNREDILKLYGALIHSDKSQEITIYSNEMDFKAWPSNIALIAIVGVIGFLLSSGNVYVAVFTMIVMAPSYHWRREKSVITYFDPD